MRKTVLFFLILAVTAMIVGGSGALYYYHKLESSSETIQGTYTVQQPDSLKEMHLTLSGKEKYTIETTDENTVMFKTKDTINSTTKGSLKAQESERKIAVDIQATSENQQKDRAILDFGVVNNFFTTNVITIPKSVESLVIETADEVRSVTINPANMKKIALDVRKTDVNLNNISANQLTVKTTDGLISDNGSKVKQAEYTSVDGSIYLSNVNLNEAKAITDNGALQITNAKGTFTGTTSIGNIFVTNLTGRGIFNSSKGDFSMETPAIPKQLDVTLEHGSIEVVSYEIFKNIHIKGDSKDGNVTLLEKDRTSYKEGAGTNRFNLNTDYGDIDVSAPSE